MSPSSMLAPGPVYHAGYVVTDMSRAIAHWAEQLGAGPFFLFENFSFTDPVFEGRPVGPSVTLAFAYSGDFCVELIQQHDDVPSIYREAGSGLHHLGIAVDDLESSLGTYSAAGVQSLFKGGFPFGGGCAYLDTRKQLGFLTELVERNPVIDGLLAQIRSAHADWNRKDHVASFS
ncbi:MAG: VOC family protein [Steroidobacteraceae bacterium]